MLWGLLWIIGIYGSAVAILHTLYAIHRGKKPQMTYFVLVTHNNGTQIEWYLRSLMFFSWLRGRYISIAVFDDYSTDDTMEIIQQFAEDRSNVSFELGEDRLEAYLEAHQDDAVVVYRVSGSGKGEGLPVLQW